MRAADLTAELCARVREARARRQRLRPYGSGSKVGLLPRCAERTAQEAELLPLADHAGIERYEPTELVLTVRAGTPLRYIEQMLAAEDQQLAFEPPRFQGGGTIGGAVAMGLAGPARPWFGSVADALLGVRMINGLGEALRFGGEVMKNVAGYDITRLQAGARGSLGVLLSLSLRVAPRPEYEETRVLVLDLDAALERMRLWGRLPVPLSATAWCEGRLYVRLSGAAVAVRKAAANLGGDASGEASSFWSGVRDQQHAWFRQPRPLLRLGIAPGAPAAAMGDYLGESGPSGVSDQFIEWGGGVALVLCSGWCRGA